MEEMRKNSKKIVLRGKGFQFPECGLGKIGVCICPSMQLCCYIRLSVGLKDLVSLSSFDGLVEEY